MDKKKQKEINDQIAEIKAKLKSDLKQKAPLEKGAILQIMLFIIWGIVNLYLFNTRFWEVSNFFNFWVVFFLLMMNIPLFILKDEQTSKSKIAALVFFVAFSIFLGFGIAIAYNQAMLFSIAAWLPNYLLVLFYGRKQDLDNLKGNTGCFVVFWMAILLGSVAISMTGNADFLGKNKNYAYLINTIYCGFSAVAVYCSNRYRNVKND
ncbi:hypothetical protein [Soonwooa sp.]|uniref:hypothetical protein n=1 Tax=Soonwooa sp. TaxID=1938592 RepID=UPI0026381329|nr:hypothetical protein [Soonwooa sp.]